MNSANLLHSADSIILPDFLRNSWQVISEMTHQRFSCKSEELFKSCPKINSLAWPRSEPNSTKDSQSISRIILSPILPNLMPSHSSGETSSIRASKSSLILLCPVSWHFHSHRFSAGPFPTPGGIIINVVYCRAGGGVYCLITRYFGRIGLSFSQPSPSSSYFAV